MIWPQVQAYWESLATHIKYVLEAGIQLGVPMHKLRLHDQSKYSQEEFWAYADYFYDEHGHQRKHEDRTKEMINRLDEAWHHHLMRNDHHWQYWLCLDEYNMEGDIVENGCFIMPHTTLLEMVADWMGASMAYTKSWDMTDWLISNIPKIRLHPATIYDLRKVLDDLGYTPAIDPIYFVNEQETLNDQKNNQRSNSKIR